MAAMSHKCPPSSQQIGTFSWDCCNCCFTWAAIKWLLSQNCTARESEIRFSVGRVGRYQSVGSIGSHTTKIRSGVE